MQGTYADEGNRGGTMCNVDRSCFHVVVNPGIRDAIEGGAPAYEKAGRVATPRGGPCGRHSPPACAPEVQVQLRHWCVDHFTQARPARHADSIGTPHHVRADGGALASMQRGTHACYSTRLFGLVCYCTCRTYDTSWNHELGPLTHSESGNSAYHSFREFLT